MLTVQEITYIHRDKELLFENISFSVQKHDKVALIGNNGSGKSTLLKIAAGIIQPTQGIVKNESKPYYVPQLFGQFNDYTIAGALKIENQLNALHEILKGNVSEQNLNLLNDDWTIEEICREALSYWNLCKLSLTHTMEKLSGGEKTKIFLAGILIHKPDIVLFDEPTNHLDTQSRELFYNYIKSCNKTFMVVSHDRTLLELLAPIYELDKRGITTYGGNYSFYKKQKEIEENALFHQLEDKEKILRKAKKAERESMERKQRQDIRGKRKHEKEGVSRIFMKKLKNNAELSAAKLKEVHSEKIGTISDELKEVRQKLPDIKKMKIDFDNSMLHIGKILVTAQNINFGYNNKLLWKDALNFRIRSGERINIKGENGSGKTTLIRIILGELQPKCGLLNRANFKSVYIDQDYSLIMNNLTVYEQAQEYNFDALQEHDIKIRLNRFLFNKEFWNKPCGTLSGGEKMRLMLCCVMIGNHAPDLFVLDEPTNNLDIQNTEILTSAINAYKGTVIVVSHDSYFLTEINVSGIIKI